MAEQRKKSESVLLRTESKNISLELFPASEWPEENGGAGLYRVRMRSWPAGCETPERNAKGIWYCPTGNFSFLSRRAIGDLVAALLNGGELPPEDPAPYLPLKADVSVYVDDDLFGHKIGSIRVEPYQKRDGRWYCQVWLPGGPKEFCCNDVTLRRVRR